MSIAGSINSLSDVDISYIGSAEDAIALSSVVQLGVSDELRKFLKGEIEAKSSLSDVIKNYSELKSQLSSLLAQPISKLTPESIKNAGTSSEALSKVFNADGIRLGSNFADSSAALQTLQEQGVNLSTSVEYPFFLESYDSKGNLVSEDAGWFSQGFKDGIAKILPGTPSDKYTNATVYYLGEPGKSNQITVFNDQKNIRVDPQSIDSSLVQAKDKYDSYLDALNKSIAKINTATTKLNDAIDDIDKVSAAQQKMIADLRNSKESNTTQVLDTRRIDRINFLNKLDQNNQYEKEIKSINSINSDSILDKNKSNKVENSSPISDWKSTETKSNQSLEEELFQARDNLNDKKSQNKSVTYFDVDKNI
jgi:prefoldin subunit 5